MACIVSRRTRLKRSLKVDRRCNRALFRMFELSRRHFPKLQLRNVSSILFVMIFSLCVAAQNYPTSAPQPAMPSPTAWPTSQYAATAAKDPGVQKAKHVLDDMIRALGG